MLLHVINLFVEGNNSTMDFDYHFNPKISQNLSIYIGNNGEGKSFSMRLLNEYISALKEFNKATTSINDKKLHYNRYVLTAGSDNNKFIIDTGYIDHPQKTDTNTSILYNISNIKIYDINNKSPISFSDEKIELFQSLPTIIAPDYNGLGKVNSEPWKISNKPSRHVYVDKLKRIFNRKNPTLRNILNETLSKYCNLTLSIKGNELKYVKSENDTNNYAWVSSGEQAIIYNWAYLLYELNKPKNRQNALLMIDEPECSLHPEWQRKYLNNLLDMISKVNDRCQILIATHSPLIINAYNDMQSKIYKITSTNEGKNNHKKTEQQLSTYGHNIENTLTTSMGMIDTRSVGFCEDFNNLVYELRKNTTLEKTTSVSIINQAKQLKKALPQDDELWIFLDMIEKERFNWK